MIERRQHAAVKRSDESGAADVGDLGVAEVERRELRQPCRRQRQRTCGRGRRHEGGEALVAERVVHETQRFQRRQPPQGWRESHQARVADGVAAQNKDLEPRQGASAQGSGQCRGACPAARPRPAPPPAAARRLGRLLGWRRGSATPALAASSPACPAEPGQRERGDDTILAAPQNQLAAQRCHRLVLSPQLLPQFLRQRPQLGASAAEVHGEARLEHAPQTLEDAAVLVRAQLRERHRGAARARSGWVASMASTTPSNGDEPLREIQAG
eukprot:scaffold46961_cov81-Phaeocystis_antarctica.AAC.4